MAKEKTNAQLLKELQNKLRIGAKGGALSNEKVAYRDWLKENTGIKLLPNGKKVTVWKTGPMKGMVFNKNAGIKQFYRKQYGTETPYKDYKYLQEAERSRIRFDTQKSDSVRVNLSKKDYLGNNIYQQEIAQREAKDKLRLNKLAKGTSFETVRYEEKPTVVKPGETTVEKEDPTLVKINAPKNKQEEQRELLRQNRQKNESTDDVNSYKQNEELKISKKAPKQVGKLSINPGGLVGRYDDVRRSDGRSTALSIAQEDFMGVKKGEMLGVLTRSQRNLYDREVLKIGG